MALNDWADREEDARERPGRPIPAGDVAPDTALAVAIGLSLGSLALVFPMREGLRPLGVSSLLLASVWTYDLWAKQSPAGGPGTMAAARALDVLSGTGGHLTRSALEAAGLVGGHTLLITVVSRRETDDAGSGLAIGALAGVALMTVAGGLLLTRRGSADGRSAQCWSLGCLGLYAAAMGRAGLTMLRRGDARSTQRFIGTGVFANMALQSALLARRGKLAKAAVILAVWPLGLQAARRVAVS